MIINLDKIDNVNTLLHDLEYTLCNTKVVLTSVDFSKVDERLIAAIESRSVVTKRNTYASS